MSNSYSRNPPDISPEAAKGYSILYIDPVASPETILGLYQRLQDDLVSKNPDRYSMLKLVVNEKMPDRSEGEIACRTQVLINGNRSDHDVAIIEAAKKYGKVYSMVQNGSKWAYVQKK